MATSWRDWYVKCYYFRKTDGKLHIKCQGVTDASCLCWEFDRKEDFLIQLDTFCCDKYEFCEVYQMLKKIYESED